MESISENHIAIFKALWYLVLLKEMVYVKKQIIIGITIIACVALCAAMWPRSAEVGDLPAEPVKTAVNAKIEARSEETSQIILSADTPEPEKEAVAESEPQKTEITAEKETQKPASAQTVQPFKPTPPSSEPHMGDIRFVDGEKKIYILGFGWIKDDGGGSVGTIAEDMYENGNKIGVMGGGTTVGSPGDELTGNKVGIMGGTVGSNGDINKQVGIMGGDECPSSAPTAPPTEHPEITGNVIYTELQPPVTKDSTPPAYKPDGEPYNP